MRISARQSSRLSSSWSGGVDPLSPVVVRFLIWLNPSGMVRPIEDIFIDIEDCSANSSGKNLFFFQVGPGKTTPVNHTWGEEPQPYHLYQVSTTERMNFCNFFCLCSTLLVSSDTIFQSGQTMTHTALKSLEWAAILMERLYSLYSQTVALLRIPLDFYCEQLYGS